MISVVIPTHNRAELLPRAINSVLNQTYEDIEIIIVSDGSTDNTSAIVSSYKQKDSRIKYIELMPGSGSNVARNTGIKASSGEYIAFLDDDDEWMPNKIEKQAQILDNDEQVGLVYTGVRIVYVNEHVEYNSLSRKEGDLRKEILFDNCIGTTSTVIFRKCLIEKSGYFDEKLKALQDYDLWIRICQLCNVAVVPEELINYYNYTGTMQISSSTNKYIEAFATINSKYQRYFEMLSEEEKNIKLHNEYMLLSNKSMRNRNGKLAREYLWKDLKLKINKKALAYYCFSFVPYQYLLKMRSLFKIRENTHEN